MATSNVYGFMRFRNGRIVLCVRFPDNNGFWALGNNRSYDAHLSRFMGGTTVDGERFEAFKLMSLLYGG